MPLSVHVPSWSLLERFRRTTRTVRTMAWAKSERHFFFGAETRADERPQSHAVLAGRAEGEIRKLPGGNHERLLTLRTKRGYRRFLEARHRGNGRSHESSHDHSMVPSWCAHVRFSRVWGVRGLHVESRESGV